MATCCPHLDPDDVEALISHVRAEPWLVNVLNVVAASGLPDAWIGAGVLRDVVWGHRHDGFDPAAVRDIDVAFFDPNDLSRRRDDIAQQRLVSMVDLPWEATNQAAVHTWYAEHFHEDPVPPLASVHDAVATWPETATCVAVRSAPMRGEPPRVRHRGLRSVRPRRPPERRLASQPDATERGRVGGPTSPTPGRGTWPTVVVHDPARS